MKKNFFSARFFVQNLDVSREPSFRANDRPIGDVSLASSSSFSSDRRSHKSQNIRDEKANFSSKISCLLIFQEVRRKRSVWTAKFEQIDRMMLSGISAKQREQRKQLFDAFQALRNEHAKRLTYQKAERIKLRGGKDTDNIFDQLSANAHEESVEILLKTEEVEYKP